MITETKQLTIKQHLQSDAFKAAIAEALPEHVTADRMARAALNAITRTPDLAKCDQASFFKCMMDLSQWGLEPDGRHAHLIPFRNTKRGVTECQLIIDYKGLVQLAYNSGKVANIHADVVYAGDLFGYNLGQVTKHTPWYLRTDADKPAEQGDPIAAFCIVGLHGGAVKCEVMSRDEIDGIRNRSKAGRNGPWQTDWSEMAKKTAFRRASKWIPLSAAVRDAFERTHDMQIEAPIRRIVNTEDVMARLTSPQATPAASDETDTYDDAIGSAVTTDEVYGILEEIDDDASLDMATKAVLAAAAQTRIAELAKA